jgi:hypothetical protein
MGRIGRPKQLSGEERTTTIMLDIATQEAILNLQLRRLRSTGRKPTLRDLVREGVDSLLRQEGLEALPSASPLPSGTVIPISKTAS